MAIKQVIVLRTDLNMRKGKMAAQAAHASMKVLLDRGRMGSLCTENGYEGSINEQCLYVPIEAGPPVFVFTLTPAMQQWLSGAFVKIVVGVESEAGLLALHEKAQVLGIPCAIIKDNGTTEFGGVPTYTALAVGPAEPELVDRVTGGLKLL